MRVDLAHAHGTRPVYRSGCRCLACRAAESARHRRQRDLNPEAHRESVRRYRRNHPGGSAEYDRQRYQEKGVAIRQRSREWYARNREHAQEYSRRWREEHPDQACEASREYRLSHLDAYAAYASNRRARERGACGSHSASDVADQLRRQRRRCFWCDGLLRGFYHADHVVPLALGGSDGPENIVIACPRCNQTKSAKHPMDFAGVLL